MTFGDYKLLGCPICGLRVDTREESCGRCGHRFSEDTKFECPFCGEPVPSGSTACPTCHVDFSTFAGEGEGRLKDTNIDNLLMDIIKLESSQVKAEAKKRGCPRCAWLLDGTEKECPKCKLDLGKEVSFQCPVCGELVDQHEDRCPACGSTFADDYDQEIRSKTHEEVESRLSEIMEVVGIDEPQAMPEPPPRPPTRAEPVKEPPTPPREIVVPKATIEATPKPPPAIARPVREPEPEPVQEVPEKTEPTPSKKPRQRKLKTKTGAKKSA